MAVQFKYTFCDGGNIGSAQRDALSALFKHMVKQFQRFLWDVCLAFFNKDLHIEVF